MVNYPNMKKNPILTVNSTSQKHYTAHRGMSLEEDISLSNEYYLIHNRAVITKSQLPFRLLKLTILVENQLKLLKPITKHLLQLIIMVSTVRNMLTLKQKKQKQRHFRLEISLNIKLIICKESSIMVELLLLLLHLQA